MKKLVLAGACGVVALLAQVDPPMAGGLRFEVASLKRSASAERTGLRGGPGTDDPTRFSGSALMSDIFRAALGTGAVASGRILQGAPAWVGLDRFQIAANVPAGATKEQFQEMLQNLLKDRMGLEFHWTKKEIDAYTLVVARGGLKLKPAAAAVGAVSLGNGEPAKLDGDKYPILAAGASGTPIQDTNGVVRMTIRGATIAQIATRITRGIVPIADGTGLTGLYDGKVEYSEKSLIDLMGSSIPPSGDDPAPDIFAAFEKQLGLRLEKGKMQIDVVVIDHLNRVPVEN